MGHDSLVSAIYARPIRASMTQFFSHFQDLRPKFLGILLELESSYKSTHNVKKLSNNGANIRNFHHKNNKTKGENLKK